MMILVTYKSKTGFTKKYAEWISEELSCEVKAVNEVKAEDMSAYDLIIHGGWIMGGMINGLDNVRNMKPKKLVVFGVGFSKKGENDESIIETNNLGDTPFFYMEGGMNPKKMGFFSKLIVKMVTKQPVTYSDNTNKKYVMELVDCVKAM